MEIIETEMGYMPFTRTLEDWAKFDISNRTKFDASISSGLAIMACQRASLQPVKKSQKLSLTLQGITIKEVTVKL